MLLSCLQRQHPMSITFIMLPAKTFHCKQLFCECLAHWFCALVYTSLGSGVSHKVCTAPHRRLYTHTHRIMQCLGEMHTDSCEAGKTLGRMYPARILGRTSCRDAVSSQVCTLFLVFIIMVFLFSVLLGFFLLTAESHDLRRMLLVLHAKVRTQIQVSSLLIYA